MPFFHILNEMSLKFEKNYISKINSNYKITIPILTSVDTYGQLLIISSPNLLYFIEIAV